MISSTLAPSLILKQVTIASAISAGRINRPVGTSVPSHEEVNVEHGRISVTVTAVGLNTSRNTWFRPLTANFVTVYVPAEATGYRLAIELMLKICPRRFSRMRRPTARDRRWGVI